MSCVCTPILTWVPGTDVQDESFKIAGVRCVHGVFSAYFIKRQNYLSITGGTSTTVVVHKKGSMILPVISLHVYDSVVIIGYINQ